MKAKTITLKRRKAKIIRLNSAHQQVLQADVGERDRLRGKEPSLHHLLQGRKRIYQRTILHAYDKNGDLKTTTVDILRIFAEAMQHKCDSITTSEESLRRLLECGLRAIPERANAALEEPITIDELSQAIKQSKPKKPQGETAYVWSFTRKRGRQPNRSC
jgi:hypothetical protein